MSLHQKIVVYKNICNLIKNISPWDEGALSEKNFNNLETI